MAISVSSLLQNSFSSRSFHEKLAIVTNGKPKPDMSTSLSCSFNHKGRKINRKFSNNRFETISWLTGCTVTNKLYCWPCLLLNPQSNVWNAKGYSDLNHLTRAAQKHEKSKNHIKASFSATMFGRQRIDTSLNQQIREELSRHNENVRANREILRKLIKATCFLARPELPFRGHSESSESINRGNYVELLEYTREYEALLNSHLQSAIVFKGTSPTVQNELISACNDVLLDAITDEMKNARFAAIILDETSDIASKSQLSTVIRYVCNGEVY